MLSRNNPPLRISVFLCCSLLPLGASGTALAGQHHEAAKSGSPGHHLLISSRVQAAYRIFVDRCLRQKHPRLAYQAMAAVSMKQRQPAFGSTRESTIEQWETMANMPSSHFEPTSISFNDDMAVTRFEGHLQSNGPGVQVTLRDRLRNGKIVEEWGEMRPLSKP